MHPNGCVRERKKNSTYGLQQKFCFVSQAQMVSIKGMRIMVSLYTCYDVVQVNKIQCAHMPKNNCICSNVYLCACFHFILYAFPSCIKRHSRPLATKANRFGCQKKNS